MVDGHIDGKKMSEEDIKNGLNKLHSRILKSNFSKYTSELEVMALVEVKNLINRQKAEIDILIRKKETLRDEICELQAENEKLKTELVGMRGAANSIKCTMTMHRQRLRD